MRTRWVFQAIGSGTVLVAAVLAALIALLALGNETGWDATWRAVGVTPLKPHFFDMHAVTDQAACSAQGYNAYEVNSCAPLKFNYPPIWLQLGYLGINGLDSAWLSILVAFIAFVVVATLLKGRSALNGVLSSAAILSPSVMMGVERGNIDLVILALVGSAALVFKDTNFRRAFGASLVVLVAVLLKLYPVFCVALVAKFNRRTLFFAITLIIGSLIYFYSIFDYLPIIRANTPTSFMLSYGYKVIFLGLDHLRAEAGREALRAGGVIRRELDHLAKAFARAVIIEVEERFVTFSPQLVEAGAGIGGLSLGSDRAKRDQQQQCNASHTYGVYAQVAKRFRNPVTLK